MGKKQEDGGLSPAELEAQEAAPLPQREAMSLINTGGGLLSGYTADDAGSMLGGTSSGGTEPTSGTGTTDPTGTSGTAGTGTADTASGAANDATGMANTTADGSATEQGSITSEPRSDQYQSSNSAYAGPS